MKTEIKETETKICLTYDEVLEIFNDDNLSVVNVFGPPPPDKRINGEWVWKKQQPIMGWKVEVEQIKN
jgi:hypothetical protein